uniref:exocyst complex component EXO70A1-like isoform X2 n=1 Tax=Erigeron canadensis TaxID=72917 RepID=UPI001CB99D37|nr:exocyst complex component EXO70A1-like isoform X2 [Erigeron canadensis]
MSSSFSNSMLTHFIKVSDHLCIPFQDIQQATKNFSTLIGKGGYGLVYKGELLISGKLTLVAIKRLDTNISGQGLKEFLTEIHLLSCYKHPNLVSLVGFCEEDDEKIIIYDYAERGSLEKYLTKGKSTVQLTWLQRINICIDAARGLDYLHNHVAQDQRIIHRDIKSANILLSHDWKAMIADFGLSTIGRANEKFSFIITNASGTHGYCDPAYMRTGVLTKESDVYSFGVVLFEVLCGRLGFINVNSEQRFLAPLAKRYYEMGRLSEIIDPYLKFEVDSESLNRFSVIAYQCLLKDRERRPSIGLVLKKLEVEAKILRGPQENLQGYKNKSFKSSDGVPSQTNNLPSNAIAELEHEFKQLLSVCSIPVEPDRIYECLPSSLSRKSGSSFGSSESDTSKNDPSDSHTAVYKPLVLIPARLITVLHDLAQDMVNGGHTQQYLIIYRDIRSQLLQKCLHQLGVEKPSEDLIRNMEPEAVAHKMGTWIDSMRIAVKLLFAAERNLCDQMFEGIESLKDQCFAEVTQGSVDMLLNFGYVVVESKRSPKNFFVLLNMYKIVLELHSEIETLFSAKACKVIIEAVLCFTMQLAQTVKGTLRAFEEAVEKDATRITSGDMNVHRLTTYVINYFECLFNYRFLKQLFQEFDGGVAFNTQLASVTMRIMQGLQTNLERKSKEFTYLAYSKLFVMNNIHYVVQFVSRSEAKNLLGDDWVQQLRRIVQQYANQYKRIAWAKILQCLSIQGAGSLGGDEGNNSGASHALVKERLRIFNSQFGKLHHRQSQWIVPDSELRVSLRLAIAEYLLPAYKAFIQQFGSLVKNRHKYIRYSSEDLDRMVGEFFKEDR